MSTSSTDEEGQGQLQADLPLVRLHRAKSLLRRIGKRPSKGLGQHFLVNTGVLNKILAASQLDAQDTVIEVGPGLGILTQELARRVARVIAVELDATLAEFLSESLAAYQNTTIVQADILRLDPATLLQTEQGELENRSAERPALQMDQSPDTPMFRRQDQIRYKVVADLPYNIAAPVLRHFLEAPARPDLLVVMVQQEVARRMTAKPGEMSRLSLGVQLYGRPIIVEKVAPRSFYPVPKVNSAIVRIEVFPKPAVDIPPDELFRVVRAGFSQPRKQLRNTLGAGLGLGTVKVEALLVEAGIDPQRRPQTLLLEEWAALCRVIKEDCDTLG